MDQIQQSSVFSWLYFIHPHPPPFFFLCYSIFRTNPTHHIISPCKYFRGRIEHFLTVVAGFDCWFVPEQALPNERKFTGHFPSTTQWKLHAQNSEYYPDSSKNSWREVTCYNDTVDDNTEGNCRGERLFCGLKGKYFLKSLILEIENQRNRAWVSHY